MAVSPDFGVFPFGTHVYREPFRSVDAVLDDLPILKRLGFNMIKIQESWATDEPQEGVYDFSRVERIIARAGELDLGVYLGLTMEHVPAWFWQTHPDCFLTYANGLPHNDRTQYVLPADGKPGPCWDHPDVLEAGKRFVAELARSLGKYDNIWAWNTWQEIGFWPNQGDALGFCYCPHTLARYQDWLQERYGTLDALNQRWQSAYADWAAIEPPRRATAVPPFIDWRYFMDNVYISHALTWKTEAIKANDPQQRPVFSHVGGAQLGSGVEWRWSQTGDFFGNSNYPAWHAFESWDDAYLERDEWHATTLYEMWNGLMMRTDYSRSANGRDRAFWGAEFQGGAISTQLHLGRTPAAADIQRWMLAGLASGMNGISFWNHRAEWFWQECNGFGLLDPLGDTTERIEEAGRVGRAISCHADLFAQGQPPRARVALIVSDDLYHFAQGSQNPQNQVLRLLTYNLRGHYARLWRLGIPVDFVDASEVVVGGLAAYDAAILPMPLALGGEFFDLISAYVADGGVLISEACPGRFDDYGFCPSEQMVAGGEAVFGARHARVQLVREPGTPRWSPESRGFGEFREATDFDGAGAFEGSHLRASFYVQSLEPTTAVPIFTAGDDVVGVQNRFGEGVAILLGTYAGLCATAHMHEESDTAIAKLLQEYAGIGPDHGGTLLRRRRELGDRQAWFFINPLDVAVTETIDLETFTAAEDLLGADVGDLSSGSCMITVAPVSIRCLVLK